MGVAVGVLVALVVLQGQAIRARRSEGARAERVFERAMASQERQSNIAIKALGEQSGEIARTVAEGVAAAVAPPQIVPGEDGDAPGDPYEGLDLADLADGFERFAASQPSPGPTVRMADPDEIEAHG